MAPGCLVMLLLAVAIQTCSVSADVAHRRTLLQTREYSNTEGASLSPLATYISWVKAKCGDPTKVTSGNCLQLKGELCGTRDTSEVLCRGGSSPSVSFRSASRYTRVGYLDCSLTSLTCTISPEVLPAGAKPGGTVDPTSIAAWQAYVAKCYGSNFNPKVTTAGTCAQLSGDHCSRKDVACLKDGADFKDVKTGKVVARGDSSRGLLFVYRP